MSNMLILAALPMSSVTSPRGTGAANLATPDPKEAWVDSAVGTDAVIEIDLGSVQSIDTIFLGYVSPPTAGATWSVLTGVAAHGEAYMVTTRALRAVDRAGAAPALSHALYTGAAVYARYVRIYVNQPAGNPVLSIGNVLIGKAFTPTWNKEWGAGRKVIDSGRATALLSGGFATVEGARRGAYGFTLGDLTDAEVDQLYDLVTDRGETLPVLVVEDPAATTGQRNRIHYGLFQGLRQYERRNPKQTRWEFMIEEWK